MKKIELEEENKKLRKAYKDLDKKYIELYSKYYKEKTEINNIYELIFTIITCIIFAYLGFTLFAWIIKLTIKFWIGLF